MVVSFIAGGNRSTRGKSPTYRKSPTNYHIMRSSTPHHGGIRTHNFCGDKHWLHDHNHDAPKIPKRN